jgi:hypothetical protein
MLTGRASLDNVKCFLDSHVVCSLRAAFDVHLERNSTPPLSIECMATSAYIALDEYGKSQVARASYIWQNSNHTRFREGIHRTLSSLVCILSLRYR